MTYCAFQVVFHDPNFFFFFCFKTESVVLFFISVFFVTEIQISVIESSFLLVCVVVCILFLLKTFGGIVFLFKRTRMNSPVQYSRHQSVRLSLVIIYRLYILPFTVYLDIC